MSSADAKGISSFSSVDAKPLKKHESRDYVESEEESDESDLGSLATTPSSTVASGSSRLSLCFLEEPQVTDRLEVSDFCLPPDPELDGLIKPPQSSSIKTVV